MSANTWISDEEYVAWLWQTSHAAMQRTPLGQRVFAEAAVHALLATLRGVTSVERLRERYERSSVPAHALLRSVLPPEQVVGMLAGPLEAEREWLQRLEDAAYYLRYCELTGRSPEADRAPHPGEE
jgi:hypothetical protein